MKVVIIYLENHKESILQAKQCIKSCQKFGYDVTTLKGSTPRDMKIDFEYDEIKDARVRIFKKENHRKYLAKKACFSNHIRIWQKVVEMGEPILVLEHDAIAIKEWDNPEYKDVLCLNMKSAMSRTIFNSTRAPEEAYKYEGSINLEDSKSKLIYNRKNIFEKSYMLPGTASYAINPHGAIKLLKELTVHGWEQSDYFINTRNVDIKYTVPDYFTLNKNNLLTSHGIL